MSATTAATTTTTTTATNTESKTKKVTESRQVNLKVLSKAQREGVGAVVRRSIGGSQLRNFDPFLMLDEFRVAPPAGFPDHPHRGFETVTYMLPTTKGSFNHEDFCGHKGTIGPGDLQWMTAGKGILHSEMPASKEESHGLQLWVNLAAKDKMCNPQYQEHKSSNVPKVTKDGVTVSVIAGESMGIKSKIYTRTPTYYLHFIIDKNTTFDQEIPVGWNSFVYVLDGEAYFGGETSNNLGTAHYTLTLTEKGDGLTIITKDKGVNFVLLSGQPLKEPVVQYGPFVMNTQAEIQRAFQDYQMGRNGFEKAPGWRSEIGRSITDGYSEDE